MAGATIDLATIEAGIKALDGIDIAGLEAALTSQAAAGYMLAAEDAAKLIVPFVPDAQYVVDALEALILIDKLRQLGFWAPARPEDKALSRAADGGGASPQWGQTPNMHDGKDIILPGGTAEDPYGFDRR